MEPHPSRPAGIRWLAWALLLAGLAPAAGAQQIAKPELFGKSLRAAHQALEHYGAVDDSEARRRVADIGYELAVQSDFRAAPFTFYLIEMPVPNAFALPGGHLFVTSGMLDLGLTDDMLACLLGHEIAHVTEQHGTRMQKRATLLNVLSQALLVGVMVGVDDEPENPYDPYGRTGSRKGSLVQGAAATGMVISELLLRNYSRDFEDEADVEGQRLAAAAGYDPDGARQLWQLMNQRIPQANQYGYWRTHPFSDQRMRAAEVRAAELKIQENPRPPEDYRAKTQKVLLEYRDGDRKKKEADLGPFLDLSALTAWPEGPRAEKLRIGALHRRREAEMELEELSRDYGELVRAYQVQIEEVRSLTPESAFLATLESELHELRDAADGLLAKALEVWEGGFYQTPFLEVFLSNHPTAEVVPEVALALGNAYSRLGRQADGVSQYLRAAEAGPETEAGKQALQGLRNLTPYLDKPAALQQLHDEIDDDELRELSHKRLDKIASDYEDLADGADYLHRFPSGDHAEEVGERLEELAQNLYGEVVLYQGVGDHVKALDRIQQILTHAPLSRAAEAVRERAVLDS
ncbi:MAG: M48 family metalloprotease [bacterium]|nr:M48 family metalloprotease [bacterium]